MQIWKWSVKFAVQILHEKEKRGKKTHGHVILLDSIKYHNNFVLKKSLTACLNQIKPQILNKKLVFNLHVYVSYDTYELTI